MSIRDYRHFYQIYDDLAWLGDIFFDPNRTTYTVRGEFVDTSKFDIVPKLEYRQKLIEAKQKELEANEENRKRLEEELNKLKNS